MLRKTKRSALFVVNFNLFRHERRLIKQGKIQEAAISFWLMMWSVDTIFSSMKRCGASRNALDKMAQELGFGDYEEAHGYSKYRKALAALVQ